MEAGGKALQVQVKRRRLHRHCGTFLLGLMSLAAIGQQPASGTAAPVPGAQTAPATPLTGGQAPFTLKVSTQLVQLDVVVRNAKGDIVKGLTGADFSVLEQDVPQKVIAFDVTAPSTAVAGRLAGINSTAELDRQAPEAPVTVIVLDEISSRFEDQYFARYSLDKYLGMQGDTLNQPIMLVARTIDRTLVLSDYTTSKEKILDALNHHFAGNDWRANNPNFNDLQVGAAFASLLEVAKATQGHAGHKNLVWIGRGFPTLQWANLAPQQVQGLEDAVTSCVDLLRQARITLYVIDPTGVQANSATSDENGVVTLDDPFDRSASFDTLARATGGTFMHGRNNVDRLIGDAVVNGEFFYTLAYRPSSPEQAQPTKYRAIRVVLNDKSLTATSRQGYYPAESNTLVNSAAASGTSDGGAVEFASAASGLMVYDGVPLTLKRQGPLLSEVGISFPASTLGLAPVEGKLRGNVTLIALSYDRSGKLLAKDGRVLTLHLAGLEAGKVEQRQVNVITKLNLDLPIARVRVIIRSDANNNIGAENLYLAPPPH